VELKVICFEFKEVENNKGSKTEGAVEDSEECHSVGNDDEV
jgi:hypothetical protein